jgi:diguanylate cyclase (GGDEF)-like protein
MEAEWRPTTRRNGSRENAGVYERAVHGIRRLAALTADGGERDVVDDALVRELRVVLDVESVSLVTRDESGGARQTEVLDESAEHPEGRELSVVLKLHSPARASETVILLADEPHELGADEVAAAAALVEAAALVRGLHGAQQQAATDELTGCLNRRAVFARLRDEIARAQRTRAPVSCLMLDIDNLKQINDTFGHLEGDRVLREAGASLRGELRAYDLAARYGGDEFLVVLPAVEQRAGVQAGTRMAAAVARIRSPANATARVPVSVTFGAATSHPGDVPDTLLQRADQALLNAKRRTHASRGPKG